MSARVFISYRSADGTDKATALARDLGAVFGPDQVFLDKDDLRGGSVWREEIERALGQRVVMLLLMTPQLLAATDAEGSLRINEPDDPVRRELEAALAVGATIVPVLCDGLTFAPDTAALPPPFDRLGDRTWRKLRAYDWKGDLQRLVDDLQGMGLRPVVTAAVPGLGANRRRLGLAAAAVATVLAGAALLVLKLAGPAPTALGLSGEWTATLEGEPAFTLLLQQQGSELTFTSMPVAVAARADWADYRRSWHAQGGGDLQHVVYRGAGTVRSDPGAALVIDVALKINSQPGDVPIDSGNLSAARSADGLRLTGRWWLNSRQSDRPIELRRKLE